MIEDKDIEEMAQRYVRRLSGKKGAACTYLKTVRDTMGKEIAERVSDRAVEIILND